MRIVRVVLVLGAAGCASAPPKSLPDPAKPETPPPSSSTAAVIAYDTPPGGSLVYELADSTSSNIEGGPIGTIKVSLASHGVAELKSEPGAGGQRITITFRDFDGSFSNSAGGGTVTATEADIKSPTVLTVTPRGEVTVVQRPEVTPAFRQVAGAEGFFRRFIARVPGGPVRLGMSWTDTIVAEESMEGVSSKTRNIVRSTYARDSVVAGRKMFYITYVSDRTLDVSGKTQGVDIAQKLSGTANGYMFWDPARHAIYERDERVAMDGSFDLPGMNITGMPIRATGRALLKLKE